MGNHFVTVDVPTRNGGIITSDMSGGRTYAGSNNIAFGSAGAVNALCDITANHTPTLITANGVCYLARDGTKSDVANRVMQSMLPQSLKVSILAPG